MEDLQSLYKKLEAGNIELPDFNTFQAKYGSDTGMTTLHNKLQKGNIEVPDLNTFKSKYLSTPATQTPIPQQEAPVSQTSASKQKANVEAPKFVAPTNVAPINPKTIKTPTTPAFNKQKLVENEADLGVNLKKRAEDIDKEYNNKIKNFASSSIYQDVYSGPKISGTFKLGDKTFTVGSNPQLNVRSLEQERVKKIDQVDKIAAAQKNKLATGPKQQKLLTDNEYVQTVLTDELEGLKSDRQYYATLASNPKNILENTEAPGFDFGNIFSAMSGQPSLKNNPVKPEILQSLNIQPTGDNKKDYALVQKALANKVSTIDANITQKTQDLGLSRTDTKNLRNQVDYLANMLDFTDSEAVFSAARLNPKIAKQEEEISKNVGEVTTIDMPSAEAGKLTSAKGALVSSILNILPTGLGGNTASLLSGLYNMSKEGFSKKASYLNLNEEKKQLTNYDAAYQTIGKTNELRLTKTYDDLTNQFQVPKEKIKSLALALLNIPNNTKPQFADVQDQALFEGIFDNKVSRDKFLNIVNTYGNTSREFDVEGKKMRLSLAEANKITALKAKEFGTLQKFQSDIEKEQAYVDVMNKKSKDASILSNDFFNKLAYETAYSLTRGKATTQDIVGGAAKVGQTIYEDVLKGEVSDLTKSNIDELIKSTDLFDVFVPTNSALQLGLFNTNKFIPVKDQSGKNISIEVTPQGDVKNIHAEDYTYIIRDPKQKQAIIDYYNQNKEELLNSAVTLSKTEGGKRAIFDNTVRNVENQLIDEVPILAFELVAGGGTGALLANTDKMRKISQYAIAATSNMLETYPMIYKGYEEDTNDPNNPYAAMLTTGALGMVSLLTSGLDRRLIGLGQNAVSKEILPNVITNSAPIIKAISKETLKISDKSIREIAFKSAVNKAMIKEAMNAMKPAFKTAMSKGRQTLGEQVAEIGEEVGTEPLTRYVTNFLNSAILGNQAYKQKTLDELDFLNPETAWLTFWTAGAISSAGNIAQSIQNNNPYTQVDYVKAALKKPDEVMKMLDNISDENPPEVIQKVKDDYNALQNSYQTKKKDLNISQDLLESLDFNNPAVQIVMSQAGINKAVVDNIRGNKNYDALLIQQVLEEKKAKDLEAEIQDGISQGLIMETESGYKAVGNNPLSKPYEKTIADFQKANNNIQYFNNFITEFNNKTAPVQRQFVNELQKSLAAAPDLYDVKQENEDESSLYYNVNDFNTLRTNTLSKLLNETRLTEINSEISDKKSENKDVEKLQQEKEEVTKAITESTNAINLIQQQYKPGRTETDEELKKTTDTNRLAQIELATVIDAVSRMQDIDNLDLDNHEINDVYEKYNQTVKDRNQVVSKLKKEYKVDVPMQPEITPEQFSEIKQTITRKYNLGKNIESGKGNLADLTEYVDLSTNLGVINPDETLQEPESSEDIDDIVNDPQQLVMQAKAMNLSPLLSALNVKKRVSSKLHAQLNEAEQEKTLGINEILNTKIDQTSGQNTTYVIDGKEYTIANRPNSNTTTISEQQKSQIILDELGREVARRIFSESMDLNPNTIETIMNKVISESYPELALELDENTLRLISANILKLKIELENQGFNILFNDKVISSVFATPSEADNAVVGIASKIPLIAVSPEGNIHLINFKLFTGSTADNLGIFNEEMTVLESLFKDNDVNITGIHMLPIKVKTTFKDNILKVEKTSLDFRETDNSVSPSLIQLQTDVALENDILTNLGTNAVEEVVEEPTSALEPQAVIEPTITPEAEIDTDSEEVEPVSASPTYNVGGTTNGVYITIVDKKLANGNTIYKIQIENNPDLNAEYKNKNFKSEGEVKAEYAKKGWFVPEKIITNTAYSLQDSEGNSIKSPISPITSDKINNLSFVSEGRGQEVTIEEQDETMNDDTSIQSNFANKANLVIKSGDEIIAVVPFNSPIRRKLQTITVDGKMRLAPTTAKINKVIQKDFDRTAPVTLGNWLLDFSKANGAYTYDVGYVQYDNKKETFVLKNTKDKTIFIYSPEKQPTLGATYLIVKDENGKETRFALQTPKLRDVVLNDGSKPTREEIINLMQLIPNQFKTESGKKLYTNIINGLRTVIANSTNPRIIEIADLVAKELGAEETLGRAESTAEQLATLDYLPAYSPETKKEIEETIADFFLNRIITLTENSISKHLITTNPETIFLDNTLEVNDLVSGDYSEEAVKLQGLSDADFLDLVTSKGMVQINPDCL